MPPRLTRRTFAATVAGGLSLLAGCLAREEGDPTATDGPSTASSDDADPESGESTMDDLIEPLHARRCSCPACRGG